MGFYVTEGLGGTVCECREKTHPPSKNRVVGSRRFSADRARLSAPQTLEPHREKQPTPTTTASGVRFYGYRYYNPGLGRWLSRDPKREIGFRIAIDWEGREMFTYIRSRLVNKLERMASAFSRGGSSRRVSRAIIHFAGKMRATTYEQFVASMGNTYCFCGNDPINLLDLLGLEDSGEDETPWPPPDPGEGEEGDFGDVAKALWEWFKSEHEEEINEIEEAVEEWIEENKPEACCIGVVAGSCYLIAQKEFTDEIEIPEIPITITDGVKLTVKACKAFSGDEECSVEVKLKWEF